MRKVLPMSRIREMEPYMDAKVLDYIHEGQIEAFEGFEDFDLIAFDWYDVRSERTAASQMLLYLDREDLFVFCEDDAAEDAAQAALLVPEEEALSNEQVLHRFFVRLLRGDMAHLDRLEADISDGETEVLTGAHEAYLDRIIAWRQELLRLKRYYEQLDSIFDELAENDNSLLGKQNTRRFANLGNRMERYLNAVQSLRESVAQLREAYQSQLSIQQNDLMKIFTVVTAVFLPLTLLVGWYGMNFVGMPELHWKYGYPAVILVSVGIVAALAAPIGGRPALCLAAVQVARSRRYLSMSKASSFVSPLRYRGWWGWPDFSRGPAVNHPAPAALASAAKSRIQSIRYPRFSMMFPQAAHRAGAGDRERRYRKALRFSAWSTGLQDRSISSGRVARWA